MPQNVSTAGWSTVYAASFPVVNAAILARKSYPESFEYEKDFDGLKVKVEGKWKSWQLAGGGGGDVKMTCVVESGTVSSAGTPKGDLKDSKVFIQVKLQKVPAPDQSFRDPTARPGTGEAHAIKVLTSPSGVEPAVVVLRGDYPGVSSELIRDLLNSVFADCLNADIGSFSHTFSVMMLNEQADKGDFAWLKPSDMAYAVASTEDGDVSKAVFGTLALTDGAKVTGGMQQVIDARALQDLPEGANSAFVISREKMTQHMLLKGAVCTIQGSTESDFEIGGDGVTLRNNKELLWGNFELKDGKVISPMLAPGNFVMRAENDYILLEIVDAHYVPSLGISVHMNCTQKFAFKTVKRETDGKFVLVPDTKSFGSPKVVVSVEVEEWLKILEITLAVLGGVAGLMAAGSAIGSAIMKAATTAATSATEAVIEITTEAFEEVIEGASEEVLEAVEGDAAEEVDTAMAGAGGAGEIQQGSFLLTSQFRAYCGFAAAVAGIAAAGIGVAKFVTEEEYDKLPPIDDFVANSLDAVKWPATSNVELKSVQLRDSLVFGAKLS